MRLAITLVATGGYINNSNKRGWVVVKINEVDLKGFAVVLVSGEMAKGLEKMKGAYKIATLDSVPPAIKAGEEVKNDLKLHLVQGTRWSGDIVADLPDNRVLCIKGSIFSRSSAVKGEQVTQKVGQIA